MHAKFASKFHTQAPFHILHTITLLHMLVEYFGSSPNHHQKWLNRSINPDNSIIVQHSRGLIIFLFDALLDILPGILNLLQCQCRGISILLRRGNNILAVSGSVLLHRCRWLSRKDNRYLLVLFAERV